jgi:putative redox protein
MKETIDVNWTGEMSFEASIGEYKISIDADPSVGGQNKGPKPKPLMMVSLAGCTGMDVISILKKMRVEHGGLNIKVEGELTDDHPKKYTKMKVIYEFKGKDLPMDKLQKAVDMSKDKYCGVSASLKEVIDISYEIKLV